jgi:MoaA/NifB/PqqE/SkfB family radical SAM enzyme
MDFIDLAERSQQQVVYCWGAGRIGKLAKKYLEQHQVRVSGWIDRSLEATALEGIPVIRPEQITQSAIDVIIVTMALQYPEINDQLVAAGFVKDKTFFVWKDDQTWRFEIDICSICQLRCPSCPQGNFTGLQVPTGLMPFALFQNIVTKIKTEYPFTTDLQLYSWGEPFLHPDLAAMIEYAHQQGLAVSLSSNLNDIKDLQTIVAAEPEWIRISLSGIGDHYGVKSHIRGRWDKVFKNMQRLSDTIKALQKTITVEINFHMYRYNQDDHDELLAIATHFGFFIKANNAYIDPLDSLLNYVQTGFLNDKLKQVIPDLRYDFDQLIKQCRTNLKRSCSSQQTIAIHSDGSVRHCPHTFGQSYLFPKPFLHLSVEELTQLFLNRQLCEDCQGYGLNQFYTKALNQL